MSIPFLDRIKQAFAPVSNDDIANKKYVDDVAAAKAASSHTHTIGNVTNLQTALTNLQATLDGKAASSHTHTASEITDLSTAIGGSIRAWARINASGSIMAGSGIASAAWTGGRCKITLSTPAPHTNYAVIGTSYNVPAPVLTEEPRQGSRTTSAFWIVLNNITTTEAAGEFSVMVLY